MPLEAIELRKSYRGRGEVVRGVSFKVERGEIVGLLGPNGAGKTTSFYMVLGLVHANSGQVLLDGESLNGLPMHIRCRRGIGYLAQEPSVFRRLSVRDNLLLILEVQGVPRVQRRERADELLEKLGLTALADKQGMVLSGGEKRRVEIARTLCADPAYILLDEPFTGVDPIAIEDIQTIVHGLRSESRGVLITDHNVRETLGITDRAYIISEGQIRTHGDATDLPDDPIARKYYFGENFRM
jgi:lipopolysaccharide export system ATP-binding protein